MTDTKLLRTQKLVARDQRKMEKQDRRETRKLYRRCFFTKPRGHEWVSQVDEITGKVVRRCVACHKPV